jgi:hypothetical protein
MKVKCSICDWETDFLNNHGIKRHEDWHDPSQPHKSKNKVWGKVDWKITSINNKDVYDLYEQ